MKGKTSLLSLALAFILLSINPVRLQKPTKINRSAGYTRGRESCTQIKKKGEFAGGLKKEDFLVYEDDAKQEITQFSEGDPPLSIVLLPMMRIRRARLNPSNKRPTLSSTLES